MIAAAVGAEAPTNIVAFDVPDAAAFVASAREHGVLVGAVGKHRVRALTHLDVTEDDARRAATVLSHLLGR